MTPTEEGNLANRLGDVHKRIQQIAELEAKSAETGGWTGVPELLTEREKLFQELHEILDQFARKRNAGSVRRLKATRNVASE